MEENMARKALNKLLLLTILGIAVVGLNACPAVAAKTDKNQGLRIAPIQSSPEGQTYGRWAVEWYQWAIGVPFSNSPLTDTTGANCAERQVGKVWFLAGSTGSDPVVRTCDVPAGKSLFFPLINTFYGAWLNDPPETRTEDVVRSMANCTVPVDILVKIDGAEVQKPSQFFTGASGSQSPFFNVQMTPDNPWPEYEIEELLLSPSAEQGYYLFVYSLAPGEHTIEWTASGCTEGQSQDIRYNFTVTP
jgi:hypothetical protein